MSKHALPQDSAARDAIVNNIGHNMLVEAAAGTGKTTSMVNRMINLIRNGTAIEDMVAITFTRKAAAELQGRFYRELQANAQNGSLEPAKQKLFERALAQIDRCYIGTIHSYCASLLREWPFEAGVGMNFTEIDDDADKLIRQQAWDEFVSRCFVSDGPENLWAQKLDEVDLSFNLVRSAFFVFCEYPDVTDWPAENPGLPNADELHHVVQQLLILKREMLELQPQLPQTREDWGNDTLLPEYFRLPGQIDRLDINSPSNVLLFLNDNFSSPRKIVQKNWPDKEMAKDRLAKWNAFCENVAAPQIQRLFAYRYSLLIELFTQAGRVYDEIRTRMNVLNFQDLLMRAADMLRGSKPVREYYFSQNTHLLVDEFQDTDPIQAELMFLMTSNDPSITDWRSCTPKPGSLFVVGDPKQSIYRFRRADIQTYNFVKKKIDACGEIVRLTCNFRSSTDVIGWANDIFGVDSEDFFAAEASDMQAAAETMHVGRDDSSHARQADINGVYSLTIDQSGNKTDPAVQEESQKIAGFIRNAIDTGKTIVDFKNDGRPSARAVRAGDFMIITRNKTHMAVYARALNEMDLPAQVTGGGELNSTPEIRWLLDSLRAVTRPLDPVALVATLRSELWGISDAELMEYKRAGGEFSYRTRIPSDLSQKIAEKFSAAFAAMKNFSQLLDGEYPPVVLAEKMLEELGLLMRGAARPGGMGNVGAMCRLLELLRNRQREKSSAAELVSMLEDIVSGNLSFDTIPPRPLAQAPVRVMNLHKAKGLQAPIVFLACPRGNRKYDVTNHIHRGDDGVKGYMAFFRETGFGKTAIAFPAGWNDAGGWNGIESGFLNAEDNRLLYVAATRAGRSLVVSTHPKQLAANFWDPFRERLTNELPLSHPPVTSIIDTEKSLHEIEAINVQKIATKIAATKESIRQPTYMVCAAKSFAMHQTDREELQLKGEFDSLGLNWGSAVHRMLEIYMRNGDVNLASAAQDTAREYDLDETMTTELLQTVRSVAGSSLWVRARESQRCLVEVPFDVPGQHEDKPMILSGVIDIAFEAPNGWVIADYKTDAVAKSEPQAVAEHYRPQMELYADVWQKITGSAVCETGIYLVAAEKYIVLQ